MIARRLGRSVVLVEKGTHPRMVIGESSTPLSNLLLEELATRYDLPALRPLTKWGTWQRDYPNIAVGLKRGFTFHHHVLGGEASADPNHADQLLVAASPRDEIADTHWYRADVDHLLVREAQKAGVEYFDLVDLRQFEENADRVTLRGRRDGQEVTFDAKFVIDATGPRGFLHCTLQLGERELPGYPPTQAVYSHFSRVGRIDGSRFSRTNGAEPPFPIDDAAVHHVFDGGWIWVLQFNNGITSAGVAATDACASRLRFTEGEAAWKRLVERLPALREQFSESRAERSFTHIPRLSFRSAQVVGRRWAMLPSAAGFVDPLLSTGFPLTLLGVARVAEIVEQDWATARFAHRLEEYAARTDAELLVTARLIGALYANMNNFPVFVALSLLYFAAASYSETARRLGKSHLAPSFLLCDDPVLGPHSRDLMDRALQPLTQATADALIRDIYTAIEPINIAGLGRSELRNWYPVNTQDLFDSANKLGSMRAEIAAMLQRCGFASDGALVRN